MALPAFSPFHETPSGEPFDAREEEVLGEIGDGPAAALQQILAARISDWSGVGDPFVAEGPRQILEVVVSTVSRAAGYVCFGSALIGVGALIFFA